MLMDEENKREGYDLEAIMAEFRSPSPVSSDAPPEERETAEKPNTGQSRRLVMKSIDDAFTPEEAAILSTQVEERAPEPETPTPEAGPEQGQEQEPEQVRVYQPKHLRKTPSPPPPVPEPEDGDENSEVELREVADSAQTDQYAAADAGEEAPSQEEDAEKEKSAMERFLSPFYALMALIAMKREQRAGAEKQRPTVEQEAEEPLRPDPDPEKAARFYGSQMRSLAIRGRISAVLCLMMIYLSFAYSSTALPLPGALGRGLRVLSLLLLILEITVVMTGLDIFTGGLLAVARRRMGAESLVAVSCLLSMLDAVVLAIVNKPDYGIPFCAVSALSMCFALWGAYYTCKGRRTSFRVLNASRNIFTVTAERGLASDDVALLKSTRPAEGFIRRSEEADLGEYAYAILSPVLLAASLVLGLLSALVRGQAGAALHCVSILSAACATFSCTICYSVPFFVAARRLNQSGAAIAGWSGLRDVGAGHYVVITDADVFPRGTVEIDKIRILEGTFTDKVISYTGSVIAASGSELAGPFAELIRRNGYSVHRVENFAPHDGGGMVAMVNGESVFVGGGGFMNLMGIRLPQKLNTINSLFVAINGNLVGIFTIVYHPTSSVQDALVMLLHSKLEPIFAIRDFNITPSMIKSRFKMPTDKFKFPAYTERFRISAAEPDNDSRVAAVIVRDGMGPLVDVAERGRRVHLGIRAATAVSALGSILGLIIMFLLCWTRAFDSASASNVITFMVLWLLPLVLILIGMER